MYRLDKLVSWPSANIPGDMQVELKGMADRIISMRQKLHSSLKAVGAPGTWGAAAVHVLPDPTACFWPSCRMKICNIWLTVVSLLPPQTTS